MKNKKTGRRAGLGPLAGALLTLVAPMMFSPGVASADLLRSGTTVLVSTFPDGTPADGGEPSVSDDGRYVAFSSRDQLIPGARECREVYRKDMVAAMTVLISAGVPCENFEPSISGDANKVLFLSGVCFGSSCHGYRAYVRDIAAQTTTLVSDPLFLVEHARISRDGKWAVRIHENSTNDVESVGVTNIETGARRFIATICGPQINDNCTADISGDGRFIAFESRNSHVSQDTDDNFDVYLYDRDTDDNFDVYLYDRDTDGNGVFDETGKTSIQLVGILPSGSDWTSRHPVISDDGSVVAFRGVGDLQDPMLGFSNVYARHLLSATTTLVSENFLGVPSTPPLALFGTAISGDGNLVAFTTYEPLRSIDTNPGLDVFARNLSAQKTFLTSILPDGTQGIGDRRNPDISTNGKFVAFEGRLSSDLSYDRRVYLRDLLAPCTLSVCPLDL